MEVLLKEARAGKVLAIGEAPGQTLELSANRSSVMGCVYESQQLETGLGFDKDLFWAERAAYRAMKLTELQNSPPDLKEMLHTNVLRIYNRFASKL